MERDRMTQLQRQTLYRCLLNGTHDANDIYHPCPRCLLENDEEQDWANLWEEVKTK